MIITELIALGKMLFKSKPSDSDRLELTLMFHFPFKRYSYMMWCGRFIAHAKNYNVAEFYAMDETNADYNHELIHLRQAQVKGSWVKYYLSYVWEWIKGNPFRKSAYYTNPYEMEAYTNEMDKDYCKDYNKENIKRYIIPAKKRHSMYKNEGLNSPFYWKFHIRKNF